MENDFLFWQNLVRLLDQYQRLSSWLAKQKQAPDLAAIAAALCCSERNARLVLQRMQGEGWITWRPGSGRGHRSTVALLQDYETIRLQHLHHLIADGKLEAAFEGLPSAGRERLRQALPGYLGAGKAGTLRIPFYRPLHALDPIYINRRTEVHIITQLCAGLTEYDHERERIVPALAHEWECMPDGRHWKFWIRPGLRFQDGRALGAEDAADTLRRLRDTASLYQPLFAHLHGIEHERQQLILDLAFPDHLLLNRLAHHSAVIVPSGDWHRADFASFPIGAGAFNLTRNNEHRATLSAFEGYFKERALLDEIDLWVVPNASKLPEVDIRLAHSIYLNSPDTPARWTKVRQMEQGCDFVMLNPARKHFSSGSARLAVGAWLRESASVLALKENRPMAEGMLPHWKHLESRSDGLLKPPALPGSIRIVSYQLESHISLAEYIAAQLREAGIKVSVTVLAFPEFASFAWREWADMAISGEVLDNDMEFGLCSWLAGEAVFNQWVDAKTRKWLDKAGAAIAAEAGINERAALIEAAFARLVGEGWLLPMRHTRHGVDFAPHLGGVQLGRCGWMDFRKLWLR